MSENHATPKGSSSTSETKERPKCGIIMPISATDGMPESHWSDVLKILTEALDTAGFQSDLVSTAEEVGIIQKTIIQNLYNNPMVVCDVSGKNPNVMFELGIRLAFDKPTIIVKDDKTDYTFDTSQIEHLNYPRDLRFGRIVDFKSKLAEKVKHTHRASTDPDFTTFLKHFGKFKVAKIDETEVSGQDFIIDELQTLKQSITRLESSTRSRSTDPTEITPVYVSLDDTSLPQRKKIIQYLQKEHPEVLAALHGDHLSLLPREGKVSLRNILNDLHDLFPPDNSTKDTAPTTSL